MDAFQRWASGPASYNYCRICGSAPQTGMDEPNRVTRFWEPDDGWIIGALCRYCVMEFGDAEPSPDDYAYSTTTGVVDHEETDEDVTGILMDLEGAV